MNAKVRNPIGVDLSGAKYGNALETAQRQDVHGDRGGKRRSRARLGWCDTI